MQSLPASLADIADSEPELARALEVLTGYSLYAERVLPDHADWLAHQWRRGGLTGALDLDSIIAAEATDEGLDGGNAPASEEQQMGWLRQMRHRLLLLIMWRDFAGIDSVAQTLAALSSLAAILIDRALSMADAIMTERFGSPRSSAGDRQFMVVLGMGKLGGGELNFSSDVDLIFSFSEAGQTDGPRPLSNEEFFARVVRRTVKLLDAVTQQGFVYRVDLRLRPFGEAGRLALSFAAMEQYYLREGRDWERYALQKARPVAGDIEQGMALLKMLRPFVYRRYLDFGAFDALRQMKALIRANGQEQQRNIKLGPGGIREIEFLTQAFQLVRGGRQAALCQVGLLPALAALAEHQLLPEQEVNDLIQAYGFLRKVENRLQQKDDQQTHQLPVNDSELDQLAGVCGFSDVQSFSQTLADWRKLVHDIFRQTFAPVKSAAQDQWEWKAWNLSADHSQTELALTQLKFAEPVQAAQLLQRFRHRPALRDAGTRGRALIDQLLPQIIKEVAGAGGATKLLRDVLEIVLSIARRTAYLALLTERPKVAERLIWVCGHSEWLTERILNQAGLLDDLITPAPSLNTRQLDQQMNRATAAADNDPEQELMALSQCQQREMVAIAMSFLNGELDALAVGALLTNLAQVLLSKVISMVQQELQRRHGSPGAVSFSVIGYGTLGTGEMRFDSDLDLVFLTDTLADDARTDGPNSLRLQQFYTRLVQRVLSMLTLRTPFGRLYEVDTRLRPNGNAGFLVSAMSAYERYQTRSAWIWEWQALVRARWVAGSVEAAEGFNAIRRRVLAMPRNQAELRQQICSMRQKMQRETVGAADRFKFRPGARLDIEFLAQYLCLARASEYPRLADSASTPQLLTTAAAHGLLTDAQRDALVAGYQSSADCELRISLGAELPDSFGDAEAPVVAIWQSLMEGE